MQRYDTDQLGSEVDTDDNDDGRDDNGMMLTMLMVMVMMTTAFAENGDVDQNINNHDS